MIHHGLPVRDTLVAATSGAAHALGLDADLGTVAPGKLADLAILDGDPPAEPAILGDAGRFWLVLQAGTPVAGAGLDVGVTDLGTVPA